MKELTSKDKSLNAQSADISERIWAMSQELLYGFSRLNHEDKANRICGYLQEAYARGLVLRLELSKEEIKALVQRLRKRSDINIYGMR